MEVNLMTSLTRKGTADLTSFMSYQSGIMNKIFSGGEVPDQAVTANDLDKAGSPSIM